MPDSDRDRRRLSDATRQRIDDLADGWGMPTEVAGEAAAEPERSSTEDVLQSVAPPSTSRVVPSATAPSPVRQAPVSEPAAPIASASTSTSAKLAAPRLRPAPVSPPPARPPALVRTTGVTKLADSGASDAAEPSEPARTRSDTTVSEPDDDAPELLPATASARLRAPVSSSPPTTATASAPRLRPPPTSAPPTRPTPASLSHVRTTGQVSTATTPAATTRVDDAEPAAVVASPDEGSGPRRKRATGSLRTPATLPRRRGLLGDALYVFTVLFGVARSRRELTAVDLAIDVERERRAERMRELARETIADEDVALPIVVAAREALSGTEDARSRCAGGVAAADSDIATLRRERECDRGERAERIAALDAELVEIAGALAPLERDAVRIRRRAAQHRATLAAIDRRIAAASANLVSAKPKVDKATAQADLASLRADRQGVEREEPEIATELHALEPKLASLNAARKDTEARIRGARQAERDAVLRTEERIAAVTAQRTVEQRGVIDADQAREAALLELGEELCAERPEELRARLEKVDEHDLAIATRERRGHELGELLASVDRAAVARGIACWAAVLAVAGTVAYFLV